MGGSGSGSLMGLRSSCWLGVCSHQGCLELGVPSKPTHAVFGRSRLWAGELYSYAPLRRLLGFFFFFLLFRDALAANGGSQFRGRIRAVAAGLHHSQSNAGPLIH